MPEALAAPYTGTGRTLDEIMGHLLEVQTDCKEVITFLDLILAAETEADRAVQKAQLRGVASRYAGDMSTQQGQIAERMAGRWSSWIACPSGSTSASTPSHRRSWWPSSGSSSS